MLIGSCIYEVAMPTVVFTITTADALFCVAVL